LQIGLIATQKKRRIEQELAQKKVAHGVAALQPNIQQVITSVH